MSRSETTSMPWAWTCASCILLLAAKQCHLPPSYLEPAHRVLPTGFMHTEAVQGVSNTLAESVLLAGHAMDHGGRHTHRWSLQKR